MKLISMVLFSGQTRYWYTLLPAVVANWELYPGWKIRLHVAADARQHPVQHLLDALSAASDRFEVYDYAGPYTNTEPSIWRMRPLWDSSVDTFLCRDIDSVPSTEELQAVKIWERSDAPVQGIRSFHLHDTLLMAGLCGFKPHLLQPLREQLPTFEDYLGVCRNYCNQCPNFVWGCDQEGLRTLFSSVPQMVLDFPIGNAGYLPAHVPHVRKEVTFAEPLPEGLNKDLLRICDEITAIPWDKFKGFAGRPQGDFRTQFQEMLKLPLPSCEVVRSVFAKHPDIEAFYKP